MIGLIPFLMIGLVMKQVYEEKIIGNRDISDENQVVVEKTIEAK